MTAPAEAARQFALGLAFGVLLGVAYDFLRPLRRRRNWPADLLTVLFGLYLWIVYSFRFCIGDIRTGNTAAMGLGALFWVFFLGKGIRGIFFLFWNGIFRIFSFIFLPLKKIFSFFRFFRKKVLAFGKKRGTIEGRNRRFIDIFRRIPTWHNTKRSPPRKPRPK